MSTKKVRYKGKTYSYPRNYKREYAERTPEQKANRTVRAKARSKMENLLGKKALKGKDIDHKGGIKKGNGKKNLAVMSPSKNRARKSLRWK